MEEKILQTLNQLNELLGDLPYELAFVDPRTLTLLDKNARYMSNEMFTNLVNNIKRDGGLSSLPLVYIENEKIQRVISGNHRVMAAVQAQVPRILILKLKKTFSREELVAIQLSHNAIEGKDDPVILKQLWEEIHDIDMKIYAGLDSEILKELDKMEFATISEVSPEFKQIIIAFLPEEQEQLKKVIAEIDTLFVGDAGYVASRKHYDEVFTLLVDIKEKYNIVNNAAALMKVIELAREYLGGKIIKLKAYN